MADEVNFKKNRKLLPNFILLPLFLVVLGGICAFLLSLTNELTKESIKKNEELAAAEELESIRDLLNNEYEMKELNNVFSSTDNVRTSGEATVPDEEKDRIDNLFKDVTLLSGRGDDYCNYEVANVFYSLDNDGNPYLTFKVLHTNNFTTVTTIVVISLNDETVKHVQVIGKATTLGSAKDNQFLNKEDEWGVVDKKEAEYRSSFTIIAGSTYSSKSVKNSIKYSFDQIHALGDEILGQLVKEA